MRVLAVSYVLPPLLYPQAIQIGRLLAHLGGEIAVVSGGTGGTRTGLEDYLDLADKTAFRLEVDYKPALSGLPMILARRFLPFYATAPDEFRSWVPLAETAVVAKLAETGFRPDVVVTFGEPMSDHLLGLRLKRRLGLPWVAHFSDPWSDLLFRRSQFLSRIVNRRDERQVVAAADRVDFTSQETLDLVMAKYPPVWRDKTSVLPHSFEPSLYPPPAPHGQGIVMRHVGTFFGKRNPLTLISALRLLLRRDPAVLDGVSFEMVGRISRALSLRPEFRTLPEGLIRMVGPVPYRRSLQLMSEADLLLVIDAPDTISVFLPSKLIDYLGSGTPIFGIVPPGTSAALLRRLAAPIADPRRPEEIAEALQRALDTVRRRRSEGETGPWGDPAIRAEFDPDLVAARFRALLGETAGVSSET